MITELEEQVMRLVKNAMIAAINYHKGSNSAEEVITELLQNSEVALHQEAINVLVQWVKESAL